MSGGFSGKSVRSVLPVFVDVAKKVVHEWGSKMICTPGSSTRLNVGKMVHLAMFDMICDAALGFPLNTVQNSDALNRFHVLVAPSIRSESALISEIFTAHTPESLLRLVFHYSPLDPFPAVLNFKIAADQLTEDKARDFETDKSEKRDLLSIILDNRSGATKMGVTYNQLLRQIPVLLLAGQDTTADVLSFAFHWLAQNPDYQQHLRQEILSSNPAEELEYDSMPLLNALLKETLRLFPAAPLLERWASEDCVLPLSSEIVTNTGKHIRDLPIRKGQFIFLAVGAYQRLETLWGPDADDFKPSRWLEGDPCTGQALGPYAQLLAFLGGPRVCAGWRFAILQMQVILAELLAKFSFSHPEDGVRAHLATTLFPVDSKGAKGLWLTVEPFVN
ncbi:cytochrome P450 [Mycena latifolia]|nr:cytochrome P450 [Mycena latifolia]